MCESLRALPGIREYVENRVLMGENRRQHWVLILIFKFSNLLYPWEIPTPPSQLYHYPLAFGLSEAHPHATSHGIMQCKQYVPQGV